MKRAIALSMICVLLSGAIAFAKPSLIPWFEVNVPDIVNGEVLPPTLDMGATVEGMLSQSWFIDLGFTYSDGNLLNSENDVGLGFASNVGFDEIAKVNDAGILVYGCLLSLTCDIVYGMEYPNRLDIDTLVPGVMAKGYVGPISLWAGVDFPLDLDTIPNPDNILFGFVPSFGMRVEFDIDL